MYKDLAILILSFLGPYNSPDELFAMAQIKDFGREIVRVFQKQKMSLSSTNCPKVMFWAADNFRLSGIGVYNVIRVCCDMRNLQKAKKYYTKYAHTSFPRSLVRRLGTLARTSRDYDFVLYIVQREICPSIKEAKKIEKISRRVNIFRFFNKRGLYMMSRENKVPSLTKWLRRGL